MSIKRDRLERVVIESGPPYVVCDGCGKRADAVVHFPGASADHPNDWIVVWEKGSLQLLPGDTLPFLGFCCWPCVARYAYRTDRPSRSAANWA
jgi:hypothetical protein